MNVARIFKGGRGGEEQIKIEIFEFRRRRKINEDY